jgi:hypothetical protein
MPDLCHQTSSNGQSKEPDLIIRPGSFQFVWQFAFCVVMLRRKQTNAISTANNTKRTRKDTHTFRAFRG